jgi:predicted MPP superfamily phosphohydrolase
MSRVLASTTFIVGMLLLDFYVFQTLRLIMQPWSERLRWTVSLIYWLPSVLAVLLFLTGPLQLTDHWPRSVRIYVFAVLIGLFLSKLTASVFFLVDDMRRIIHWTGGQLYYRLLADEPFRSAPISRSVFMSWLGIGVGGTLFGGLLWGFGNKYRYRIEHVKLNLPDLPDAFRGLRAVHISDIHSGSLTDKRAVERGVQRILDLSPDIIFFTGDLVNDHAGEMDDYREVFARLKAPLGVYSCLGNHDYGDYRSWPSQEAKAANLARLKDLHAEMGWKLLMNEHVALERNGQQLAVLGIENWGAKANFPKYGRMEDAWRGTEAYPFKILLSHDPSHWDAQVLKEYPDIDLMLSGHTHGMQFGVEIPGFRWSPVQYVYRQWAGLYRQGKQHLYVNRGFGFLGYPGRVGILPEITLLELV